MNSLYLARCTSLTQYQSPSVQRWGNMYKLIGLNISVVDRTEHIKMPFNFKLYDGFQIPNIDPNFNMSYEDCCNKRAVEIINLSRRLNKPIRVLYSGGIDSTLTLVSLIKNLSAKERKDRVIVAMNTDSIVENPNFYYEHIRDKFKIESSDNIGAFLTGDCIVLGGEFNDQLSGSDVVGKIYRQYDYSKITHPYSREYIVGWFIMQGMTEDGANAWFNLIDYQIKNIAPCEVKTNFDFFWWVNFCFKWQTVFFRMLARVDENYRKYLSVDFLKDHFIMFYGTPEFQMWSMTNPDKKLFSTWSTYKWEAKRVICEFNKDEDYRDNKVKMGSLYKLFIQKKSAEAIDSNLNFIHEDELNPIDFYNPNNSFV